jgi:hypothetical protein
MDKKLEARIARLERMLSRKNESTPYAQQKKAIAKAFEREMLDLLDKYDATIECSPDGGVWAVENAPDGIILMSF